MRRVRCWGRGDSIPAEEGEVAGAGEGVAEAGELGGVVAVLVVAVHEVPVTRLALRHRRTVELATQVGVDPAGTAMGGRGGGGCSCIDNTGDDDDGGGGGDDGDDDDDDDDNNNNEHDNNNNNGNDDDNNNNNNNNNENDNVVANNIYIYFLNKQNF